MGDDFTPLAQRQRVATPGPSTSMRVKASAAGAGFIDSGNGFQELLRSLGGGGALKRLREATMFKDAHAALVQETADRKKFHEDIALLNSRLADQRRGLLNPRGLFVQYWDMATACALLFTMWVTPYEVGLDLPTEFNGLFIANCLVGVIFLCDIFIQFVLPQPIRGTDKRGETSYERRHWRLARRYVMGWLPLDIVTVIPFDVLVWQVPATTDAHSSHRRALPHPPLSRHSRVTLASLAGRFHRAGVPPVMRLESCFKPLA